MTKPIITKAIKPPARDADIAASRLEDDRKVVPSNPVQRDRCRRQLIPEGYTTTITCIPGTLASFLGRYQKKRCRRKKPAEGAYLRRFVGLGGEKRAGS